MARNDWNSYLEKLADLQKEQEAIRINVVWREYTRSIKKFGADI